MKPIKHKYITKFHIGQRLLKLAPPLIPGGVIEIIDISKDAPDKIMIYYKYISAPDPIDVRLESTRYLKDFTKGVLDETYTPS